MKIAVLTTDTIHHRYFIQELHKFHPISRVVFEKSEPRVDHPVFALQNVIEAPFVDGAIGEYLSVSVVPKITLSSVQHIIPQWTDILFVFGTGKIPENVIDHYPCIINFHGGNPEKYRGLDSNWWAIYHGDFDDICVTAHMVEPEFDTGNILWRAPIPPWECKDLFQLRFAVTRECVRAAKWCIVRLSVSPDWRGEKQSCRGKYFSFMPPELITECSEKFKRYTEEIEAKDK